MKKNYWLLCSAVLIALPAHARVWGEFIAGGTSCNSSNVSVIEMGNDLAILFDAFGVNMPAGALGDGLSTRKTCNFRITVTPPKGFYLASFKQLYNGGLIKSRRASAQLNISYNIGAVRKTPLPIVWGSNYEVRPEDAASQFSRSYVNNLLVASCGGSTIYGINMQFSATRPNSYYEHLVGGLDSVDASFVHELTLIPEWRLCPR